MALIFYHPSTYEQLRRTRLSQKCSSEISRPLLRRFGDDVGVGVSSCVRSLAVAAVDAARELCCMLASHSKRSTFSPCKPTWSLTCITLRCHSVETIFGRKPTTKCHQGLLLPVLAAWERGFGGCARRRTLGAAVARPRARRCSSAQPHEEPCYHVSLTGSPNTRAETDQMTWIRKLIILLERYLNICLLLE